MKLSFKEMRAKLKEEERQVKELSERYKQAWKAGIDLDNKRTIKCKSDYSDTYTRYNVRDYNRVNKWNKNVKLHNMDGMDKKWYEIYMEVVNGFKVRGDIKIKRLRRTDEKYREVHHILPRTLGGLDEESNLVIIKLEEHLLLHGLLCRVYPYNRAMYKAFIRMYYGEKYHVVYEKFKNDDKAFNIFLSEYLNEHGFNNQ